MVAEHEWSPWTITKQPTCMEEGERVSTCVLCDETKTEKVAKISHKLDENNKCSMCGSYYVLSSSGTGETLVDKLKNALDGINSSSAESKVLYLESGEYDLSQIDDLVISASGLMIHGASSTDGTKTTFLVSSSNGLKVTGDSFALDNVAFTLTGDTSSSTEPVLSLTGNNATVKNTSFELGSYTNPAIGSISEGQTVTLDSVTISGGGTLNTEGTLVITDSNIKTTSSTAINGVKGNITIKSSTIEGSLSTGEKLNSLTIEGSTLTGGKGEIKGTNVTIKDSTLDDWNLSVEAETTTVTNSTINSESIKITGATDSSATVENSSLSATSVVISAESNTITGSNINKGLKDNSLTIGGKTAEIASTTLDGKVTINTTGKTDIKENCSINASDTKSSGKFVVTDGEVTISGSKLSGDITFKTGTTRATIENSSVDTSTDNNAITTGTDLEIKDSTITKGSGLYVTKDAKNIDIEITDSLVSDGSNVVDITSDNVTSDVFTKEIPDDKKSSVMGFSDSQSSASLKVGTDYTSVPFTFKDSNNNEIRVNIGKKGSTVNLSEFFEKNVKDYVNPKFYTDSTCSNEISDSKITVVDADKYKVGDTVYDSIYVKWEYRVAYTDGEGNEKTEYTQEGGKFTISTPTKNGYVFDGWKDRNGDTLKPTETDGKVTVTLTSPSTLEPIWVKTYVVTFDVNGGNALTGNSIVVRTGEKIPEAKMPTNPTHKQYTFDNWYTSEDYTTVFNCNEVTIEKDMTLYAKWKIVVTVNGKTYSSDDTKNGIKLDTLDKGTPTGCEFKGWYTDEALTKKAGDQITTSMTLYPAYECEIRISAVTDEKHSEKLNNLKVDYGKTITKAVADGFFVEGKKGTENKYISKKVDGNERYFAGWYTKNADGTENKVTENTTITTGMTLYAKWNVSYVINSETDETLISEGSTIDTRKLTADRTDKRGWVKSVKWYSDGVNITTDTVDITKTGQKLTYEEEYYLPKEIKTSTEGINFTTTNASVNPETGALTLPEYTVSDNYEFVGWYKEDGAEFSTGGYTVTSDTADLSLTPVSSRKFTITYKLDSIGENIKTNWTKNTETDTYTRYYGLDSLNKDKELKTKTDLTCGTDYAYELEGWKNTDSSDKTSVITKISAATKADITLVSSWKVAPTKTGMMVLAGDINGVPLEWYIIKIEKGRMLVLSRYALVAKGLDVDTARQDGKPDRYYKWSTSTLRLWLRQVDSSDVDKTSYFMNIYGLAKGEFKVSIDAVTNETIAYVYDTTQQKVVAGTSDDDKDSPTGNDTKNYLFLLSYEEYCDYVKDEDYRNATWIDATDADSKKTVSWWLRTPIHSYKNSSGGATSTSYSAMSVIGDYIYNDNNYTEVDINDLPNKDSTGTVNTGDLATYRNDRFIRPAFWYKYE